MTASSLQPTSGKSVPRFADIATFMRLPHVSDPAGIDVALIGVPWDGGTTNRAGARHGPREVRNQSTLIRSIHPVTRRNPFKECRVADLGDSPVNPVDLDETLELVRGFVSSIAGAGALPLVVGGDHLVTLPVLRGLGHRQPLGLIHFDAHSDTWDSYFGNHRFTHGTVFRRAAEEGLIDPRRVVQIGIRGTLYSASDNDWALAQGMRIITIEEFHEIGIERVIAEARAVIGEAPAYLTFDVDGLDPVYAPGTGTPEIGGLTTFEAQRMLRGMMGIDIVGGDVVEVSPPFDQGGMTALVGASVLFEILCLVADTISRRQPA